MDKTITEILAEADVAIAKGKLLFPTDGNAIDLGKWVTIKKYCNLFGIKDTQVVSNWIKRGVIPPENVQEIEELNGLKLIRAIDYKN